MLLMNGVDRLTVLSNQLATAIHGAHSLAGQSHCPEWDRHLSNTERMQSRMGDSFYDSNSGGVGNAVLKRLTATAAQPIPVILLLFD
jgi:hypothetical protein